MATKSNDAIPDDEMAMAASVCYTERVKQENARFHKMTNGQKRVRIAEDVIEWLNFKRLKAESVYLKLPNEWLVAEAPDKVDGIQCRVCGLGSLFVVAVERGLVDSIKLGTHTLSASGSMRNDLSPYFEEEQLVLIEDAFEGNTHNDDTCYFYDKYTPMVAGNYPPESRDNCLRAIMRNIVKNGGTFKPSTDITPADRKRFRRGYDKFCF